ncbi:helix-turn-helix domain-containing protein [Phytohabitans houttuyneae]|nr:helix-turn-helix transcriptional regulator [Phytohabitans houttuyneae]
MIANMAAGQPRPTEVGSFTARLQEMKNRSRMSFEALAKKCHTSRSALNRYVRGEKRMPDDVLKAMCDVLGAPQEEFEELRRLRDEPPGDREAVRRPSRRRIQALVAALVLIVAVATVVKVTQRGCAEAGVYKATLTGNVVNDRMKDSGDISAGELFTVITSPEHPHTDTRYYGTVQGRNVSGYVLKEKLSPQRHRMCLMARDRGAYS